MTTRLHVDAELTLTHGENIIAVWSEDDLVVVNAPSLAALRHTRSLLDALPMGLLEGERLPDVTPPVELRVRHAPVALVGPDIEGTPGVRRLFGVDAALRPRGVLVAAVRALG